MIAIIAAFTKEKRILGKNGKIPWDIKEEKQYFKSLTFGNAVIMGHRTYKEIGKPLRGRMNIIVTENTEYKTENCVSAKNLSEAIKTSENMGFEKIFIAGGERLYKEALPLAEILYLTELNYEIDGDVSFPEFNESLYTVNCLPSENPKIKYLIYTKKL